MSRPPEDEFADVRAVVLAAALPNVPFDGWTLPTLRKAAEAAGISRDQQRAAFPLGVVDLVTYWIDRRDADMLARIESADLSAMKVRERVTFAVRARLEAIASERMAAQRALSFFALPLHAPAATRALYGTVDAIWRAVGDTSVDFNFYSKRALLAGVFSATMLRFLSDDTEGFADTWAFLDRRINDVMQIEKLKSQAVQLAERLPDPFRLLGRLRYPR